MGRGSQWLLGSAVSGDGRELLQEGFLAECVEGQVPPDVGTNGSNLGRWKGSPLQTVHYKQQRALSEALRGQEKDLCLSPNSSWIHEEFSLSMEICLYFCEEQTNQGGEECAVCLSPQRPGGISFISALL